MVFILISGDQPSIYSRLASENFYKFREITILGLFLYAHTLIWGEDVPIQVRFAYENIGNAGNRNITIIFDKRYVQSSSCPCPLESSFSHHATPISPPPPPSLSPPPR